MTEEELIAATDRAVVAHRANPTAETRDAVLAALRAHHHSFLGSTVDFRTRTHSLAGDVNVQGLPTVVRVTPTAGAPTTQTIETSAAGGEQTDVSWTAPANNGDSEVKGYTVTLYIGSVAQVETTLPFADTTEIIYYGLTSWPTYTFKVAAINSVGA